MVPSSVAVEPDVVGGPCLSLNPPSLLGLSSNSGPFPLVRLKVHLNTLDNNCRSKLPENVASSVEVATT